MLKMNKWPLNSVLLQENLCSLTIAQPLTTKQTTARSMMQEGEGLKIEMRRGEFDKPGG